MCLQFRLMYSADSATEGIRWYDDPVEIVRHYVFGWFGLDFVSIVVSIFDVIPLFQEHVSPLAAVVVACMHMAGRGWPPCHMRLGRSLPRHRRRHCPPCHDCTPRHDCPPAPATFALLLAHSLARSFTDSLIH